MVVNNAHATSKPNKPQAKWYITTNHPRKIENRTQNIIPANEAENEQQTTFMIYEQIGLTFVAWNTITPANQAEKEEQTTFMNKKIEAFGLFLCEKSKKPS